jgi:cell division septal protein FtsQ
VSAYIKRFIRPFLVFLGLSLVLGGLYYFVYVSDVLTVSSVDLRGTDSFVNKTDLWNFVEANYVGENLLLINSEDISTAIGERFLGARDVTVAKKYPDVLIIDVEERIPLALLSSSDYDDDFMVDIDGYVLGVVASDYTDLPRISYEGKVRVGEFVTNDLVPTYYGLIEALEATSLKASSMKFHPSFVAFYTSDDIRVLLDYEKDKETALRTLKLLVQNLGLEGKRPSVIDLRYDKVVVSY